MWKNDAYAKRISDIYIYIYTYYTELRKIDVNQKLKGIRYG